MLRLANEALMCGLYFAFSTCEISSVLWLNGDNNLNLAKDDAMCDCILAL